MIAHQLHRQALGRLHGRPFQRDAKRPAAGAVAHAVAVAVHHAHLVEQRACPRRVVLDIRVGELLAVEPARRDDGRLAGRAPAEVHRPVDLPAVDRQRQRLAEADVPEDAPQLHVRGSQVGLDDDVDAVQPVPDVRLVAVRPLADLEQRDVRRPQLRAGDCDLPGRRLRRYHLLVGDLVHLDAVDVGELVSRRVHHRVVRVAPVRRDARAEPRQDERVQDGAIIHLPVVDVVGGPEVAHPVAEALAGGLGLQLLSRHEVRVEVLQEMPREGVVMPAVRECLQEERVGLGELVADGVVVEPGHPSAFPRRADHRAELLVHLDLLEPEHVVVGGERMAVRPSHALAQVERHRPAAVAELGLPGDVRDGPSDLRAHAVGRLDVVQDHQVRPEDRRGPPVPADPPQRLDHDRVIGQATLDGRELALGDLLGEGGRFRELGDA